MNNQDARELHQLLFRFMGLFHEKFLFRYRKHDIELPELKKNHYKIMGMLSQQEFLMSSEIGRRLDIEKGSITALIDQLVEKGLAVRQNDPGDRRKSQVSLSETGRKIMNMLTEKHSMEIARCMQNINDAEVKQFLESVRNAVTFMNEL